MAKTKVAPTGVSEQAAAAADEAVAEVVAEAKGKGRGAVRSETDGRLGGAHDGEQNFRAWVSDEVMAILRPTNVDVHTFYDGVDMTDAKARRAAEKALNAAVKAATSSIGPLVAGFLATALLGAPVTDPAVQALVDRAKGNL